MSRERIDIPEVFRKGMTEWLDDGDNSGDGGDGRHGGDGGGGGGRGGGQFRIDRRLWWVFAGLFLLFSLNWIVTTYTEWLWFSNVGYEQVWLTNWSIQVISFVIFFGIALLLTLSNWLGAYRRARNAPGIGMDILGLPGIRGIVITLSFIISFFFGVSGSAEWETFLRYLNQVPFGVTEPIFGQDVGFYLFSLPAFHFLNGWGITLFIFIILGVIGIFALSQLETLQRGLWRPLEMPSLRRHLAILVTGLLLLWAMGYWLDMFDLLYSNRGFVSGGASFTDVTYVLPALRVQLALALVLALATFYNVFRQDFRPIYAIGAVLLLTIFIGGNLFPAIMQRVVVEPNEFARETPYIEHNIEFTRLAFGLDKVEVREFGTVGDLTPESLQANEAALANVRVWDYRPLQTTYAQLQELRTYYQFSEVDIDRYEIDGQVRQVMLAARELDSDNLPANSWVNRRLEYTHGYGVVMNPVDKVTREGQPEFFIRDIPPQSNVSITVTQPAIYYGETTNEIVIVNSGLEEFDYPAGQQNEYTNYAGIGGVQLSNFLRRVAFAFRFGETNLLLSEDVDNDARLMFHRQIRERANHIAPFLAFDGDPYIVIADGRLVWMLDAYTTSTSFPYATPTNGINYIRNTVKATVDAYSGEVKFYLADESDPLIQSYARAFPGLFLPLAEMPASLQAHIRYPEDLFLIQTQRYLVYHMTDPQIFYNREDQWAVPLDQTNLNQLSGAGQSEIAGNQQAFMEPYYIMFPLPGEEDSEYLLIQPYVPNGKENMVAWLAARNDMPNYGKLVAYELPKQELVLGPTQIRARINQDTTISQQISLWNQLGSSVVHGNLIVMPLDNSFLYVEPLYLLSESSALPELKRVIVASQDRIVMRNTLDEALLAFISDAPTAEIIADVTPATDINEGDSVSPIPDTPIDASVEELIQSANSHFLAAEAAQQAGDWATYGRELDALERDLQRMMQLSGEGN
jgi:uncharacterized membrane protein (UPF0182 family)